MGSRFSVLYLLGAIVVALSGSLAGTTKASFTDTGSGTGATFTTGTINLQVTSDPACSAGYSDSISVPMLGGSATTNQTSKLPGDVINGQVCIKNVGSLDTRWSLTGTISDDASNALMNQMKIRFWALSADTSTTCVSGLSSDGSDTVISTSQTNIGQQTPTPTPSVATPTPGAGTPTATATVVAPFTTNVLVAWPTQSLGSALSMSADSRTQIAASNHYQKLCFSVVLPDYIQTASSNIAGKTLTMSFNITGNSF